MKFFHTFWHTPRRSALRQWAFRLHWYTGLSIGLLLAVVGLSGSIVVFKPEMEKALIPHLSRVEPGKQTGSLQGMYNAVQRHRPQDKIINVAMYGGSEAAWGFRLSSAQGRVQVYVNPYTGKVLGEDTYDDKFLQWVYDLHADLLGGTTGRLVNGLAGLLLTGLALSGIVIWWPGRKRLSHGFSFHQQTSWKGKNYDLHKLAGFFSAGLLVLVAITGAYFPFKDQYQALTAWTTSRPAVLESPKLANPPTNLSPAHLNLVWHNAHRALPEGQPMLLRFPQAPNENFSFRCALPGDWSRTGDNFVFLHQYTSQVIRVDRWQALPVGVKLMRAMFPLHFGTFGGTFTRVVWLILGVVPAVLFVSGFLMWWNRVVAKRLASTSRINHAHSGG